MTSAKDTSSAMRWLENTLLCILLGLIVLRATIIETSHIDQLQTRLFLSSEIVSLLISSILLACIGLWLLVSLYGANSTGAKPDSGSPSGFLFLPGFCRRVLLRINAPA